MVKTVYNSTLSGKPQAFISVNRNRIKVYQNSCVYLHDGTEFEIELFNGSSDIQKAVIAINGKTQSDALVLKPGERVYLERFMDKAKKFKFDVYEIDSSPEAQEAVKNNGLVQVWFYAEEQQTYYPTWSVAYCNSGTTTTASPHWNDITYTSNNTISAKNMKLGAQVKSYAASAPRGVINDSIKYASAGNMTFNSSVVHDAASAQETGRIADGSQSNQSFKNVYYDFSAWANTTIEYRIFPVSQQPHEVTSKDLRSYCTECGRRIKNGWVFCAGCGTRV